MINNNLSNDENQVPTLVDTSSAQPFADFNDWFASVIEEVKPELVVGIARGAIRLLQLQGAYYILSDTAIISNHALPFISDSELKSKRVLLFDDSVIFGSTMSNIKDYLINRDAIVFCASYVIDRFNFYGDTEPGTYAAIPSIFHNLPILSKHRLWPSAIRRHHNTLIRSILRKPSHYNLDFPTLCFKVPKYSEGDIPYIINLLRKINIFRELFDVSSSASSNHGVYRYTALFKKSLLWDIFPPMSGLFCRRYSKARITFSSQFGEIQITPLPQLAVTDGRLYEDVKFTNDILLSLWRRLHLPFRREDPFYQQALFRLLTSFVAIIMGEAISRQIVSTLKPEFPVKQISLLEDDIRVVIGDANSQALKQIWSDICNLNVIPGSPTERLDEERIVDIDEPIDSDLLRAVADEWMKYSNLKPHPSELPYEILSKVFLTLQTVTDSFECRMKNPKASRLEVGLSYGAINQLLEEFGIKLMPDEISLGLDICIDNGQAVPKVIRQGSIWLRVFYCGEGKYSHDIMQFKDAIYKGYSDFLKRKKAQPLSRFDMHKLCTIIKEFFPWLPISTRYYTFGMYAMVGRDETVLIPWLTDPNSGPLEIHTEGNRKVLKPKKDYESCVKPTWQPDDSRDFYDAFQYTAIAFSKLPDEAKLLLSTCRTHRHTYNAVAFEAHSWVGHIHGNFQKFLSGIRLDVDKTPEVTPDAISSLYWCTRYISEARKKYDIFHKEFNTLSNKIKQAFRRQGPASERFWQYYIDEKNTLDPSRDQEIGGRFELLMPLFTQMSRLTTFITRVLIDLGILSLDELRQKFESVGTSLEHKEFHWLTQQECQTMAIKYNEDIKQREIPGLSIVKTELPLDIPSKGDNSVREWCCKTLETVQKCFDELKASLQEFCPEYEVAEGDFPYSPDSTKRVLPDSSIERTLHDVYLLTMDIIGSTGSAQTSKFKDSVISTFERFKQQQPSLYYFETTGNDAFVVCSEDPTVLWDIANSIKVEGEMVKRAGGRFQGIRKALSFGTVVVVEKTDGRIIIKDPPLSDILPSAFGILDGFDDNEVNSYCNENSLSKNSVILIEEITARRCKQELDLNLESTDLFRVKSKHFHGRCCIHELL